MPTLFTRTFTLLNNIKPPLVEETQQEIIVAEQQPVLQKPNLSIWKAAEQGDVDAIKYYIQNTKNVNLILNTRDPDTDCTLLHLAVSSNSNHVQTLLQLLLENGADATARNIYNVQAIHMVSLHVKNPLKCIELLLDHKASPNARDGDGWTPLHYAARFCQPPDKLLELLISRGADVNLTDAGHKSPLFGLLANGDLTTSLDWLIHKAKADVGIRGNFLDQATHKTRPGTIVLQAAKYGRINCLSLLITSTIAMNQLRRVIHRDELTHATQLVKEQQMKYIGQDVDKFDTILQLLQELESILENDPLSLLNSRKMLNTVVSSPALVNNKIQRRHSSFISNLLKMRNSSNNNKAIAENNVSLFRKMSKIIRRSKSEHGTH